MTKYPTLVVVVSVVTLLGCKNDAVFRGGVDAGLACGENEKLLQGECRFACDRDSDCSQGEVCNLLLGQCGPAPVVTTPPPATYPCTAGATRCRADGKAVERCGTEGQWEVNESCPGAGYCVDSQCLACQPGKSSCSANEPTAVSICADDGNSLRQVACSGTASCQGDECRECTPNSTKCSPDGKGLLVCKLTSDESARWKWVPGGDGFDGACITQVCEATASGAQCKAPECFPGTTRCQDVATQQVCTAAGTWNTRGCSSLPNFSSSAECRAGSCVDECGDAAAAKSYFGCDYWSAVQDNSVHKFFKGNLSSGQGTVDSDFAFVVANRSETPAVVTVTRWFNGAVSTVKQVTVPPKSSPSKGLEVIKVPWQSLAADGAQVGKSVTDLKRYAYRLQSTKPITVYQFNPLDAARFSAKTCASDSVCIEVAEGGRCLTPPGTTQKRCSYNTYTNDASLLLPAHILGTSHVVIAPEHVASSASATSVPDSNFRTHVTIVGTQDNTQVTVKLSAKTIAGGGLTAQNRGDSRTLTLNSYDVLQFATADLGSQYIECTDNPFGGGLFGLGGKVCRVDNDLTGTVVSSDKPVAVFSGSSCSIVPYSAVACDHLEEQIFPFATWGKTFVAQQSQPLRMQDGTFSPRGAPDIWKIVASCPQSQCPTGTLVKLSSVPAAADILPGPAEKPNRCFSGSLTTNDCRLLGGDYVAFKKKGNFTIVADQPIAVAEFFSGQGATPDEGNLFFPNPPVQGDPSFVLLPPVEQWRSNYTVLTAPGIRDNYLGLIYDESKVQSVEVDGVAVTGFVAVPGTTYRAKNHPVSQGTHTINVVAKPGQQVVPGAGVTVYGFDEYVSYGYTGGLDLGTIVTGINPGG